MKIKSIFLLSVCILLLLSSCKKKEPVIETNFLSSIKTKPLSFEIVENITTKIKANISFMSVSIEKNKNTEAEIKKHKEFLKSELKKNFY